MSSESNKLANIIKDYLLDEGLLKKKLTGPTIEFGFQFSFPPGSKGHPMAVVNPKSKDFVIISSGIQIGESHIKALNSLKDNKIMSFFNELRKFLILKNVFFRIDNQNYKYEIIDQIFINKKGSISKNKFFKSIRFVFHCAQYSNILLDEFCSGKIKPQEFSNTKSSDFGFYT